MFWSSPPTTFSPTLPNAPELVKPNTWFAFDPNLPYLLKNTDKNTLWSGFLNTYLLAGGSSMRLPSWDSWLLLRVRVILGSRCSTLRDGGGGVQGGFSRWHRFDGGVMGGVEVRPWSRTVRAKGIGKGSVRGPSLCTYDASASGVGAADTEPERRWGKVAQGVDGVEWMDDGRARGEGLWGRSGVPRFVSWSAVSREPLSLLVGSDSQGFPSSFSSPPAPQEKTPPVQNPRRIPVGHFIIEASRNIPVPDSVAVFRQERAAINLAHSSELEPSLRIVSLTWVPVICSKASRDSFASSACTGAAQRKRHKE